MRRLSEWNLLIFAFFLYALIAVAILLALPHAFYLRGEFWEVQRYLRSLGTMYFTALFVGSAGFGWTWLTVRLGLLERRPRVLTLVYLTLPALALLSPTPLMAFGGKQLYLLTLPLAAQALLRSLYWKVRFSLILARIAIVLWLTFLGLWLWFITERSWLTSVCFDISRFPGLLAVWSCTLPLADSVVIHRLLLWRRKGVLLTRNTTFQFSLAELLVATIGIATLVSFMVKLA